MNKKYKLTSGKIIIGHQVLSRIKALRSFGNVKAGDLGGFIESEDNLSHEGNAWVYGNGGVYENAWVRDNAGVSEAARVFGNARVGGESKVFGSARISGRAWISGTAHIYGTVWIYEGSLIFGNQELCSGMWNKTISIDNKWYLVSTTLRTVYVGQ